jgi:hypothetical protein
MGVSVRIDDVKPETLERLEDAARAAGVSLSDFLRETLEAAVPVPKRRAGALAHLFEGVGEPLDGWGPLSEEELALWEGRDENPSA